MSIAGISQTDSRVSTRKSIVLDGILNAAADFLVDTILILTIQRYKHASNLDEAKFEWGSADLDQNSLWTLRSDESVSWRL